MMLLKKAKEKIKELNHWETAKKVERVEVFLDEIQERRYTSSKGNILTRIKVYDNEKTSAIIVVWGSKNEQKNLNLIDQLKQGDKFFFSYPKRPASWAIDQYGVDFWIHESESQIIFE
ncbi:MAG: hypothetical protein ACFE9L_09070 [Candidatus Hodarchaeota archaeon]